MKKFEGDDSVLFSSLSGLFFLRFFIPAIFSPQMYGLVEENPNPELQRTLIIVSKVIQSCANRTLPGDKEPYLLPMHDFISKKFAKVEQFFNTISSNNSNANPKGFEIAIKDNLKLSYLKSLYKVFCSNAKYVRKFLEESDIDMKKEKMEQFERILKLE